MAMGRRVGKRKRERVPESLYFISSPHISYELVHIPNDIFSAPK
jgi:hypothetical protein